MNAERMLLERETVQRTVLDNGLIVVSEQMPHIRSVSIGIWIRTGSRHEIAELNGISHFVEHMVFKGTKTRSAEDIARQVDSLGGNLDAFTAKECTCFNVKVLDEHLPEALGVLSDMVLNPVFNEGDITKERGVILEEIKMDEDNPDFLVHEIFVQNFWKDHPLGRPILGTRDTVRRFERTTLFDFYGERFVPGNMVVSAAGNVEHEHFVDLVRSCFEHLKPQPARQQEAPPKPQARINLRNKKSLEQVQICIGVPSYSISHQNRYSSFVMNTLLGGGMSSRLFQNIRERQGLVYSIFSELNPFRDAGCLAVYAGTSRESASKVVNSIIAEFRDLKENPVSAEELDRAKAQLKGSLMLSLESSTARMSNLARQEMYYDRFFGMSEIIERIEAVTREDVQQVSREFFLQDQIAVTVLGNLSGLKITRDQLVC
ncbi:MAG TPA: pitrilysin family protein [Candidatus Acidoferrales bacterium]|nr:pitrilysin family protein [Candidatus Acidoferrales bacterium]